MILTGFQESSQLLRGRNLLSEHGLFSDNLHFAHQCLNHYQHCHQEGVTTNLFLTGCIVLAGRLFYNVPITQGVRFPQGEGTQLVTMIEGPGLMMCATYSVVHSQKLSLHCKNISVNLLFISSEKLQKFRIGTQQPYYKISMSLDPVYLNNFFAFLLIFINSVTSITNEIFGLFFPFKCCSDYSLIYK